MYNRQLNSGLKTCALQQILTQMNLCDEEGLMCFEDDDNDDHHHLHSPCLLILMMLVMMLIKNVAA